MGDVRERADLGGFGQEVESLKGGDVTVDDRMVCHRLDQRWIGYHLARPLAFARESGDVAGQDGAELAECVLHCTLGVEVRPSRAHYLQLPVGLRRVNGHHPETGDPLFESCAFCERDPRLMLLFRPFGAAAAVPASVVRLREAFAMTHAMAVCRWQGCW